MDPPPPSLVGPADPTYLWDGEAELLGEGLVTSVVVSALAGCVLDLADVGDSVRRLMQQGGQDTLGALAEALAADEQLGDRGT